MSPCSFLPATSLSLIGAGFSLWVYFMAAYPPKPETTMEVRFPKDGQRYVEAIERAQEASHLHLVWDKASGRLIRTVGGHPVATDQELVEAIRAGLGEYDGSSVRYTVEPDVPWRDYVTTLALCTNRGFSIEISTVDSRRMKLR
jgi:hypothetical protein